MEFRDLVMYKCVVCVLYSGVQAEHAKEGFKDSTLCLDEAQETSYPTVEHSFTAGTGT